MKFHWEFAKLRKTCRARSQRCGLRLREKYSPVNENGRFGDTRLEQPGELLGKHWPAEIVSLRLVTFVGLEEFQLLQRFHAFGNDAQLQAAAHADDGGHNRRIVRGRGDLADK